MRDARVKFKGGGIEYLDEAELRQLPDETLRMHLATYNYKGQFADPNPKHLGFIIERQSAGRAPARVDETLAKRVAHIDGPCAPSPSTMAQRRAAGQRAEGLRSGCAQRASSLARCRGERSIANKGYIFLLDDMWVEPHVHESLPASCLGPPFLAKVW